MLYHKLHWVATGEGAEFLLGAAPPPFEPPLVQLLELLTSVHNMTVHD